MRAAASMSRTPWQMHHWGSIGVLTASYILARHACMHGPPHVATSRHVVQDPATALAAKPWAHAEWLVRACSRAEVRHVLRFLGLDAAGGPKECATRLLAARAAAPLLAEAAAAAAVAALLLRLRLLQLDALPLQGTSGAAAGEVGVSGSGDGAAVQYTFEAVQAAAAPNRAAAGVPIAATQPRQNGDAVVAAAASSPDGAKRKSRSKRTRTSTVRTPPDWCRIRLGRF